MVQSLRDITRNIYALTEQLLAASVPPLDIPRLAELRKLIGLARTQFYDEQERLLLQPLRASGDPALAAIARNCVDRDLELRRLGMLHYQHWTLAKVAEDPEAYRSAMRHLLGLMDDRARFAEQFAYPALSRLISSAKQPTVS